MQAVCTYQASHNCWAWRGSSGEERCSDDGEPSGTAGRPMLGAIEAEGLKDVMVVITRCGHHVCMCLLRPTLIACRAHGVVVVVGREGTSAASSSGVAGWCGPMRA